MDLRPDQRALLQHIWVALERDLAWPDVDVLQQQLDLGGRHDLDVRGIGKPLPPGLLYVDHYSWQGEVGLKLAALRYCTGTESLLDAAHRFITFCFDRYLEAASKPPLRAAMSRTEVAGRLGCQRTDPLVRQLFLVMQHETYLCGDLTEQGDGEWTFDIRIASIREFRSVRSLDDYFARVAAMAAEPEPLPKERESRVSSLVSRAHGAVLETVSGGIKIGARDAVSHVTTWVILVILAAVAVAVLAKFGLQFPTTRP